MKKIGILGGGQLGLMFLQHALTQTAKIKFLDPAENATCASFCSDFVRGDFADEQTVLDFAQDCEVIGIEIEHVNLSALEKLEQQGKTVIPSSRVLKIIQDKGLQKRFYQENNLATADFIVTENAPEIKDLPPFPFVQKTRTGGYDGKCVQIIRDENELKNLWQVPSVLEQCCEIEKEIAVVVARDQFGNHQIYPIMEMVFDEALHLVDYVQMPANLSDKQKQSAQNLALDLVNSFGEAGLYAIEMFLTCDGKLLINETAPRVHNSAHLTIEANITSQFAQMYRILSALNVGSCEQKYPFAAMINLVGIETVPELEISKIANVYLHWYRKDFRPNRKLGHITIIADNQSDLEAKVAQVKALLS